MDHMDVMEESSDEEESLELEEDRRETASDGRVNLDEGPVPDKPANKPPARALGLPATRSYQQEMLEESLRRNIIIAMDTGSGKTLIAILRMKAEAERKATKISWFFAPTVALCEQQKDAIEAALGGVVGLISGAIAPDQWKDPALWRGVLQRHRIMVSTPQVLLDALRHGYINLGRDISLLVFDEAHHAAGNHPYNSIMKEFYFRLPAQSSPDEDEFRPAILGLTASPIYGGHVATAFRAIEANLDSSIRAPSLHLDELAKFVYRPEFKRVEYKAPSDTFTVSPSRNVAALEAVIRSMDINDDPYVQSLRAKLEKMHPSPDRIRVDHKLSKAIFKETTYTHKGLKDFARAAAEICADVGTWAADWYVEKVLERAKESATPYRNLISVWQDREKVYLLGALDRIQAISVSGDPPELVATGLSDKTAKLIKSLIDEKASTDADGEEYSAIIFVTRRDAVLALHEVLCRHPMTSRQFRPGCLIGSSESSYRHSFLDITRNILLHAQKEVLGDFRTGEKNLIVSTAVAEEGIDIQACGSVVRWDLPANMTSWAQSRGRARRRRSSFILMFDDSHGHDGLIKKWETLEREMQASYNNSRPSVVPPGQESQANIDDDYLEFGIPETGALLTTDSAISHLNHFCSVLPTGTQSALVPLYDVDPPDLPEGWHENRPQVLPYEGPWGATVTLPRVVPADLRVFTVPCKFSNKLSAFRHVAFKAYRTLYQVGLLNENLLPLTSVIEPDLEEAVKGLLQDVEKRAGTASVALQLDPWAPEERSDVWFSTEIMIETLPPLLMLSRARISDLAEDDCPILHHPYRRKLQVRMRPLGLQQLSANQVEQARDFTRKIFWELYKPRMVRGQSDFAYLFLPTEQDPEASIWEERRSWLNKMDGSEGESDPKDTLDANAAILGKRFEYPDLNLIRERKSKIRNFRFIRWRYTALTSNEEVAFRKVYGDDTSIPSPLLVVKRFPNRMNFLLHLPPQEGKNSIDDEIILHPGFSVVPLLSATDTEYAMLIPSIVRYLSMSMTVDSLRATLLTPSLSRIPLGLLRTAITAPVAQAEFDYERLETLGDTVLKFVVGLQLLAEYPLWHEGYLSKKKDHSVSNSRLAKDAHRKGLYRWIIRDRFLAQKWRPNYLSCILDRNDRGLSEAEKKKSGIQQLSTKMLADVGKFEALIGASYLHGGFDLAIECCEFFDLGLKWEPIPLRVVAILSRVESTDDFPTSVTDVERMLKYTFKRKLLLVEALTHASYQFDDRTVSYERMEFLGDAVLDMVVTDFLYHAPGKNYTPGHMHLRKSAVVNAHTLAFICLHCSIEVDTSLPGPDGSGGIAIHASAQRIYLRHCLLHSSHIIMGQLNITDDRYQKNKDEIESALLTDNIFPWAALTRLQAPKILSDLIESLLGAIYLDSDGNLEVIRDVLRTLGIWPILEHIVRDNVDVVHPVSRIYKWAQQSGKEDKIKFKFERDKPANTISCALLIDEVEEFRVEMDYHGQASQNDAKFAVAEKAIRALHLRERNEGGHT
ncbi:P-loop containing nucleoside triphosphate hydrolase protein [Athelia psychrophila]|uniref:P-loop containing nucleoside triphosphate hydrolase protein n=1 Tax=Athelia psychrophila TaxID=1759441 RepID=A0A165ZLE5_9AGAM|nr:P-loop containing nucleoside triphosphate hydrolase protein [Fibularhizoctonia sp. CBS 109695]